MSEDIDVVWMLRRLSMLTLIRDGDWLYQLRQPSLRNGTPQDSTVVMTPKRL
ncbi:hypothetical protein OH492_18980 [Vibrio chagasii]|nr:hypothetical protein [Vibrio chagasii]